MSTLKERVADAARAVNDDPTLIVCFHRPLIEDCWRPRYGPRVRCAFADLPEIDYDECRHAEGEPFIGFSARYVYVCGTYDGTEWIQAVPRSPEVVEQTDEMPFVGKGSVA